MKSRLYDSLNEVFNVLDDANERLDSSKARFPFPDRRTYPDFRARLDKFLEDELGKLEKQKTSREISVDKLNKWLKGVMGVCDHEFTLKFTLSTAVDTWECKIPLNVKRDRPWTAGQYIRYCQEEIEGLIDADVDLYDNYIVFWAQINE